MKEISLKPSMNQPLRPLYGEMPTFLVPQYGEMPAFLVFGFECEVLNLLDAFRWLSGISTLQTISESCKLNIIKQIKEKQYD